jgi:hypothetical protein
MAILLAPAALALIPALAAQAMERFAAKHLSGAT